MMQPTAPPPIPSPDAILDRIGLGVGIFSVSGEPLWLNERLRSFPPDLLVALRGLIQRGGGAEAATSGQPRRVASGKDRWFEVALSLAQAVEHAPRVLIATARDLGAGRPLPEKINAIDAAGRELILLDSENTARLEVAERLALLQEKILRFAHELLHFDHLVIRVVDRHNGRLDTVVAGGMSEQAKSLEIPLDAERGGISGYVAVTGKSVICHDISQEPRYLPGLESARSTLTVPLWLHDEIVGTLNVESDALNAFDDDDRQMAEIFGRYISTALHLLQLLVVERRAASGQVVADVSAEVAVPVSEIIADATHLLADTDARGRARIAAILRNAERVRDAITAVSEGASITGLGDLASTADTWLADRRVLIADDEDVIRETVADVLRSAGATVWAAADGAAAIDIIQREPLDLVLSDIKMPHHNGYEVFSAVKAVQRACPVILITGFGYDPHHSIVRADREGLAGVLFKPFKVEQLIEEVRQALKITVVDE